MDENTWRFAQTMMWIIGMQTAFLTGVIGFVWNNLSKRMDKLEHQVEKLEDRLARLENDMVEVKTVLRLKECCMITDERQQKKVE